LNEKKLIYKLIFLLLSHLFYRFVHLVKVAIRPKATYYSVPVEADSQLNVKTEMQLFFEKHMKDPETKEWAQDVYEWLNERIGKAKRTEE